MNHLYANLWDEVLSLTARKFDIRVPFILRQILSFFAPHKPFAELYRLTVIGYYSVVNKPVNNSNSICNPPNFNHFLKWHSICVEFPDIIQQSYFRRLIITKVMLLNFKAVNDFKLIKFFSLRFCNNS